MLIILITEKGDELHDRESKNDLTIRYDDELKEHLKQIAHVTLKKFHFYEPKQSADDITDLSYDEESYIIQLLYGKLCLSKHCCSAHLPTDFPHRIDFQNEWDYFSVQTIVSHENTYKVVQNVCSRMFNICGGCPLKCT